jgi:hypothetical protein
MEGKRPERKGIEKEQSGKEGPPLSIRDGWRAEASGRPRQGQRRGKQYMGRDSLQALFSSFQIRVVSRFPFPA